MLTYSFVDLGSDSLYEHLYKYKKRYCSRKIKGRRPAALKAELCKKSEYKHSDCGKRLCPAHGRRIYLLDSKKGYFISEVRSLNNVKAKEKREIESMAREDIHYFADFISNRTGQDNFPFSIWAKLIREVVSGESATLLQPPPVGGIRNFGRQSGIISMPSGESVCRRNRLLSVREPSICTGF